MNSSYKKQLFLISLILLCACTKTIKIEKAANGTQLKELNFTVDSAQETAWHLKRGFGPVVSRHVTVVIGLPQFDEDELKEIVKAHGVDGWVVRVSHISSEGRKELGSIFSRIYGQHLHGRTESSQPKAVSFSLAYAASAISERFRAFKCPAFGHNKRVTKIDIAGEAQTQDTVLSSGPEFNDRPKVAELTPTVFNIGHSMLGSYQFEVALIRSSDRHLFTALMPIHQRVEIVTEETQDMGDCAGERPEMK